MNTVSHDQPGTAETTAGASDTKPTGASVLGEAPAVVIEAERLSSIKLVRNAKGDCQIEVKVYAHETAAEVDRIKDLAITAYSAIEQAMYRSLA